MDARQVERENQAGEVLKKTGTDTAAYSRHDKNLPTKPSIVWNSSIPFMRSRRFSSLQGPSLMA